MTDDDPIHTLAVIPVPRSIDAGAGHLHLTDRTKIFAAEESQAEADLLAADLRATTGLPLTVTADEARAGDIALVLTDEDDPVEGYRLMVDDGGAVVSASSAAGLFYGGQTLRQLLPAESPRADASEPLGDDLRLPMVTITDSPRFPWRGAMLDIARHFFDVDQITTYVDQLSAYKINRLHLHLTDDQGWRVEIPGWPALTAVGGRTDIEGGPGGSLSVDDYRTITEYAAGRHVTIVPEVDIPGHVNAALASYPELNASGEPTALVGDVTYGQSALDPSLPATGRFLTSVFTELAAMTPGPYIHLGGDEAFATEPADYDAMIGIAAAAIRDGGKVLVGWEEIVRADLEGDHLVQHWLDPLKATSAGRSGAQVILSPAQHAYLDQKYDAETVIGFDWAGYVNIDSAYDWDPLDLSVPEEAVAGVEGPLWTETVTDSDDLEFLAFPRILALAEVGWSDRDDRDLADFLHRLAAHGPRLDAQGINFHRSALVDWPPD